MNRDQDSVLRRKARSQLASASKKSPCSACRSANASRRPAGTSSFNSSGTSKGGARDCEGTDEEPGAFASFKDVVEALALNLKLRRRSGLVSELDALAGDSDELSFRAGALLVDGIAFSGRPRARELGSRPAANAARTLDRREPLELSKLESRGRK